MKRDLESKFMEIFSYAQQKNLSHIWGQFYLLSIVHLSQLSCDDYVVEVSQEKIIEISGL